MKRSIILTITILLLVCSCSSKTTEQSNDTFATSNPSTVPTEVITNTEETANNNEVPKINQECRRLWDEYENAINAMYEYQNKTAEEIIAAVDADEIQQWEENYNVARKKYGEILEQLQNTDYETLSNEDLAYISDVIERVDPKLKKLTGEQDDETE